MLLQSLHHPDTALEMFFAANNIATFLQMGSDPELKREVQNRVQNFSVPFRNGTGGKLQSIEDLLSVLWYSKLPCFDIGGITSEINGEASFLKLCKWKGKKIPCYKIFKKVTTDQGMCCAFNMEEADKIFVESTYSKTIKRLQKQEENYAFQESNITGWTWYQQNKEPKSQSGNKMGLTVVLDAHSNLISEYTINTDFKEITASIVPPGDFPLTSQNPIKIMPGHNNMIALTATQITSDPAIKTIHPTKRNCFYKDETTHILFHQNYSQIKCLFECALVVAKNVSKISCTPWFFPSNGNRERFCDPWEKTQVMEAMQNEVPSDACEHCLPDCDQAIYQPMVTALR